VLLFKVLLLLHLQDLLLSRQLPFISFTPPGDVCSKWLLCCRLLAKVVLPHSLPLLLNLLPLYQCCCCHCLSCYCFLYLTICCCSSSCSCESCIHYSSSIKQVLPFHRNTNTWACRCCSCFKCCSCLHQSCTPPSSPPAPPPATAHSFHLHHQRIINLSSGPALVPHTPALPHFFKYHSRGAFCG
jgi:hypothetical protein